MTKNLVAKDNALINASYHLDLVEQRLILLSIVEARASGKGISPNDSLTITASSYMNHFGTNRDASYKALKDACNNLFERQFSYKKINTKGNQEIVRSRWVSEVRYIENEASVKLIFSPTVAPLITLLEKNFTSYELEQVAELNSKYAVRLYEIVIAWRSSGKTPMIAIDELRHRLGVADNEYKIMADFKRWVLDYSINQINQKTNLTISYEQHKQGRKIVGFTFTVIDNNPKLLEKSQENRDPNTIDCVDNLTDIERANNKQTKSSKTTQSPKESYLIPKDKDEEEIIKSKKTYAAKNKLSKEHERNLIKQAVKEHREDKEQEEAIKHQEKQNRIKQREEDKKLLEQAKKDFKAIIANEELIKKYISANYSTPNQMHWGVQRAFYEQGELANFFLCDHVKFKELHEYKRLNLSFLSDYGL